MKKPKRLTGKLSFNSAELAPMQIHLNAGGISMPMLTTSKEVGGYQSTKDWLDFGWMGNDPKYYPDAKAMELAPKREDFVEVPFRLISATTVGAGTWKAADFSSLDVLKKSYMMLEGKTVYKDHETDSDNWVGLVTGVKWTESFTDAASGIVVPAGIDGTIAIDAKTNPKTARGVLLGALYSNSVTVEFEYEMSHHFENEWDFIERVGTFGSDGKMVRRLVKKIINYHETSLVWLGADPFAKAITAGGDGLKSIDVGSVYSYIKSENKTLVADKEKIADETDEIRECVKNNKKLSINFALDEKILSLAKANELLNEPVMDKFLKAFLASFGKELGLTTENIANLTDAQVTEHLGKITLNKPEFAKAEDNSKVVQLFSAKALEAFKAADESNKDATTVDLNTVLADFALVPTTKVTEFEKAVTDVVALTKEKTELAADAKLGKDYLGMQKSEAIRLYKTAVGEDKVDTAVIGLFEKADSAEITGLLKQYTKDATMKFSGKCGKCGSEEFEFRSSFDNKDHVETPAPAVAASTYQDIYNKHTKSSMNLLGGDDNDE